MISLCSNEAGIIVFKSLKQEEDGTLTRQEANSCIDLPVRLWTLYNQAFFNLTSWNPRLVVMNAGIETATYGLCLDNPPRPGRIALPESYLLTTVREVVITSPNELAPGTIFLPSTLFLDQLGRILYVLHEIETRKRLLTHEELLASANDWRKFQENREKTRSPEYPAAYRRGILPHLKRHGTFQIRAVQANRKDSVELVYEISAKVLRDRYENNPLNLSRCLQNSVKYIKHRLRQESMTMDWTKIMSFTLHAQLPGFWDLHSSDTYSAPILTVSV